MPGIIEGPPEEGDPPASWPSRLKWFVLLALGGLIATAAVAYGMRAMLGL